MNRCKHVQLVLLNAGRGCDVPVEWLMKIGLCWQDRVVFLCCKNWAAVLISDIPIGCGENSSCGAVNQRPRARRDREFRPPGRSQSRLSMDLAWFCFRVIGGGFACLWCRQFQESRMKLDSFCHAWQIV